MFIGGELSRSCVLLNLGVSHLWVGCFFTGSTCVLPGTWRLYSQIFRARDHQSNAHLRKTWHDCLTVSIRSPGWLCHNQVAGLWRADKSQLLYLPSPHPSPHMLWLLISAQSVHMGRSRVRVLIWSCPCCSFNVPTPVLLHSCGLRKRSQAVPDFDHPNWGKDPLEEQRKWWCPDSPITGWEGSISFPLRLCNCKLDERRTRSSEHWSEVRMRSVPCPALSSPRGL